MARSSTTWLSVACLIAVLVLPSCTAPQDAAQVVGTVDGDDNASVRVVAVLDPLAIGAVCPCGDNVGVRDYRFLATQLSKDMGLRFQCVYADTLQNACLLSPTGRVDVVIGKDSNVTFEAAQRGISLTKKAWLSDENGKTTFRGVLIVRQDDAANTPQDIIDYTIIFGKEGAVEKHRLALEYLRGQGINITEPLTTSSTCIQTLEQLSSNKTSRVAGFVSDYAYRMLPTGQGDDSGFYNQDQWKIIGHTEETPFLALFIAEHLDSQEKVDTIHNIVDLSHDPEIQKRLSSRDGFVNLDSL